VTERRGGSRAVWSEVDLEAIRAKHNDPAAQLENPAWHIHAGNPPRPESGIGFGLLLNLVGVCNTDDAGMLWKFMP